MKKVTLVLCTVLLTLAGAAEAQKATTARLAGILERAVTGEREAILRYQAFAARADEEGYPGAAALFRAAGRGEQVHAERFIAALEARGLPLPEPPVFTGAVESTGANLRTAAGLEAAERDGIYREAVTAAREAKDDQLALFFDQTRDTEVEHANMMAAAARQLDRFKDPKKYFVCGKCGYTSELDLPFCVLCRVEKHPHEVE